METKLRFLVVIGFIKNEIKAFTAVVFEEGHILVYHLEATINFNVCDPEQDMQILL